MDETTRSFTHADQDTFAALSADWNPMHVDPVAARRLLFGSPVVHGIHLVCTGLRIAVGAGLLSAPVASLRAQFVRPVLVGQPANFRAEPTEDGARIVIEAGGNRAVMIDVAIGGGKAAATVADRAERRSMSEIHNLGAMAGRSGEVALAFPHAAFEQRFPGLRAVAGDGWIAALLASTRIVGMVCPGLHSVFHELRLAARPDAGTSDRMLWSVDALREALRMVDLAVDAGQVTGRVRAFVRPEPVVQISLDDAREIVSDADLSGRTALVVGGSRGLGEVAAKLYAAAGASVVLTYASGAEDARRVVEEIGGAGIARLDVCDPAGNPPPGPFTDMAYFAAPRIAAGTGEGFDPALFARFSEVFVTGFHRLCRQLSAPVSVFYPSTVYLSERERNFKEYVAAKAAGEALAARMSRDLPGRHVYVARLPRVHTDQTAALHATRGADAAPALWPHLLRATGTAV